jgi:hypothetical protein
LTKKILAFEPGLYFDFCLLSFYKYNLAPINKIVVKKEKEKIVCCSLFHLLLKAMKEI